MSDSRIVENWLLSLDEEAAAPVEVVEVPDKLLRVSESSSNCRGGVTPTNELFEQDRKANGSEPERVLFQLAASSEDDESVGGEDQLRCRPSSAPPRQPVFIRQLSECSEYTTDTHDTGETAQVSETIVFAKHIHVETCFYLPGDCKKHNHQHRCKFYLGRG